MTEGIAKAIPAIKITLNVVMIMTLCEMPINIIEIPLVSSAISNTFLTPIKSLTRPAASASNIPIKPNNLTVEIMVKSAWMAFDVRNSFKIVYIETNDVRIVSDTKKHNTIPLLSKICLIFLKNTENFVSGIWYGLFGIARKIQKANKYKQQSR